jgi:hypothetical protein
MNAYKFPAAIKETKIPPLTYAIEITVGKWMLYAFFFIVLQWLSLLLQGARLWLLRYQATQCRR